jgi:two-component system NarL family sensor kinase
VDGADLHDVQAAHLLRSLRVAAALRIAVVVIMLGAMLLATERYEWFAQSILLACYAVGAVTVAVLVLLRVGVTAAHQRLQVITAVGDVAAIAIFEMLSTGRYVPMLVMALLPILVALEVSEIRAAMILTLCVVAFATALILDPTMQPALRWPRTIYLCGFYAFLCFTAFAVARLQRRYVDEIARLSESRQMLLADTMTAFDSERRRISESLHDGPLQSILAARQDVSEAARAAPDPRLERALSGLRQVAQRLRELTFVLHPAVLEQVGLAEAAAKVVSIAQSRSGIHITADVDSSMADSTDPMVFEVLRELVSNVERHSRATHARVELRAVNGRCRLDVIDDGIGTPPDVLVHRLAQGHIGIASQRNRIEAAGGTLVFLHSAVGTHVQMEVPLGS